MLCHHWYFKDIGYKFQPHLCNGCHSVSMMAYESKNIAILNAKGVDYRCALWGISKDEAVNRLKNSVLEDKEKDKIKEYQRKMYQELVQYKKEALKNNNFCFFLSMKKWVKRH